MAALVALYGVDLQVLEKGDAVLFELLADAGDLIAVGGNDADLFAHFGRTVDAAQADEAGQYLRNDLGLLAVRFFGDFFGRGAGGHKKGAAVAECLVGLVCGSASCLQTLVLVLQLGSFEFALVKIAVREVGHIGMHASLMGHFAPGPMPVVLLAKGKEALEKGVAPVFKAQGLQTGGAYGRAFGGLGDYGGQLALVAYHYKFLNATQQVDDGGLQQLGGFVNDGPVETLHFKQFVFALQRGYGAGKHSGGGNQVLNFGTRVQGFYALIEQQVAVLRGTTQGRANAQQLVLQVVAHRGAHLVHCPVGVAQQQNVGAALVGDFAHQSL